MTEFVAVALGLCCGAMTGLAVVALYFLARTWAERERRREWWQQNMKGKGRGQEVANG